MKLTPFRKPTFVFACVFNLVIGFGLYASTDLVPIFLGRVQGYNASEIGTTVFVSGLAQLLDVPIAAALSHMVDQRIVMTFGLTLFAVGLWMFSFMTPEWGFAALFWPQVVCSFAIMLCIVPSVGLGDNLRLHMLRLSEALGRSSEAANAAAAGLAQSIGHYVTYPALAAQMASATLARVIGREALTLAFDDVFRLMSYIFLAALVMAPFCKPPPIGGPAPKDAH